MFVLSHMIRVDNLATMSLISSIQTTFRLYFALSQTRGASYVYSAHLHPLIAKQEVVIEAALGTIKETMCSQGPREATAGGAGVKDLPREPAGPAGPAQLAYTFW
ncbi:hypothetical protein JB92DRAFT_1647589 [Gautieria morchelliformis]|nr:hypothetical protein JB92DRAFT_1647589 [Gautieria morchelliformis]